MCIFQQESWKGQLTHIFFTLISKNEASQNGNSPPRILRIQRSP